MIKCGALNFLSLVNPLVRAKSGFTKVQMLDVLAVWRGVPRHQKDFVIQVMWPGLGDHLFYSILPELLISNGLAERVWISARSPSRVPGMQEIIWGKNPFVQGFVDKPGWHNLGIRPEGGNFLDGLVYQFTGAHPILTSTMPKLYWPALKPEAGEYAIWDFNRIANRHRIGLISVIAHLVSKVREYEQIFCYKSVFADHMLAASGELDAMRRQHRICLIDQESTIGEYFSRIAGAKRFFGFYSGGAVIAAAYGIPCTTFCERYDPAISFLGSEYVET
jgi:hypothetical protein